MNKDEFNHYLYLEKMLNAAIDEQTAIQYSCESRYLLLEKRIEGLQSKLNSHVKICAIAHHVTPEQYINKLNEYYG